MPSVLIIQAPDADSERMCELGTPPTPEGASLKRFAVEYTGAS
jgi:hypothetical protein